MKLFKRDKLKNSERNEGMRTSFQDKVSIITEAGNGLGRGYALFLGSRETKVALNDLGVSRNGASRSKALSQLVVEEISTRGGKF